MRKVIDTHIKNHDDMKAFLNHYNLCSEGVVIKPIRYQVIMDFIEMLSH